MRFILWWYAVDEQGRFLFPSGVLRRPKGWGKSPFLAALAIIELIGPCRFGGWNEDGTPYAIPHPMPWVQLAAVSETQTKNTMSMVLAMLAESPAVEEYQLDLGLTRIFVGPGGIYGRLEPVTAASRTLEGGRPTFVVMDETHHWVEGNGGHKLAEVIRRNLGKSRDGSGRSIEATNAHRPGEDSVAERSWQACLYILDGKTKKANLLYDATEAPADADAYAADEPKLRAALLQAYGDATWVDHDRLVAEIYDPRTPFSEACRFYLNLIVDAPDSWVTAHAVDECHDLDGVLEDGTMVALGFDGSKTEDSTVLVAIRIEDGHVFELGSWEKPRNVKDWEVPREIVDGSVENAFGKYDVVAFFADVKEWESYVDMWADRYRSELIVKATTKHAVAYDMRGKVAEITQAAERLAAAIEDRTFRFTGRTLARHYKNTRNRPNRYGVSFGKESRESQRKIDGTASTIAARIARDYAQNNPQVLRRRKRKGGVIAWR
ncbi:hypothetical protein ACXJJ3_32830 [Kribbella sp. WER1]